MQRPGIGRRPLLAGLGMIGAGLAAGTTPVSAAPRTSAATIIRNARVWTGMYSWYPSSAVAIGRDGRILAVGNDFDVRGHLGRDTEVIDAKQATVMPGIHDGHVHPLGAAQLSLDVTLNNESLTVAQLQAKVQGFLDQSADQEPDGWLVVKEWNPVGLIGAVAHRKFLDALTTKRPILLSGSDFHNAWVNSRALQLAGITASTPSPPGGQIVKDADGPTGLLKDSAMDLVSRLVPEPDPAVLRRARIKALNQLAAQGVTSFMDAAGPDPLGVYASLLQTGDLPIRAFVAHHLEADIAKDPRASLAAARAAQRKHPAGPMLGMRTAKVFLDGVAEFPAQTAAMISPYLDENGKPTTHVGELYVSPEHFSALCVELDKAGWQVHAHAIGDRAVRVALDGYAAARRANGWRDNRHTIAHVQFCDPGDYARFARYGVVASMQMQWATRNVFTVEALEKYVGPQRHRGMYALRSLERAGAALAGGSDWPVDTLNSWNQIRTAIDRTGTASEGGALYPEQGVTRETALRMHTYGAAQQLRQDTTTGTLTPGKAADLIVLDRDVLKCPVADISSVQTQMTFVNGVAVHDASTASGKTNLIAMATSPTHNRHAACGSH
ncbi:putative amidohydrolase YtcJ [Kibdelosporangium banguiense]|uniref:Amidohydrolase YtcJ n=1 Tax=Kibdelosporangium banguiense TaxID=1365924 RepID=A0ABS4TTX8_9PSEU|nr:amidohydrolase [Kibdelosporangium banguiense]MBP2327852.1 putative amidohydrolase YtcJ [Kibdelosporangium banguiense]